MNDSFLVGNLHVRERRPAGAPEGCVLFVHGATVGSVLFDFPHPGYSLLEVGANAGWWAFALDLRGYGGSRRAVVMGQEPDGSPVLCTGAEAVADVRAVLAAIRHRTAVSRIVLAGGSWGSITVGRIAASRCEELAGVVLLAPLYGTANPSWLRLLSDPAEPAQIRRDFGGWRFVTYQDLIGRWDEELPAGPAASYRDPSVPSSLFALECKADESCPRSDAFRVPNGTLHDLFEVFSGRSVYDAQAIDVPTALIRGELDRTSTEADARLLLDQLGSAAKVLDTVPAGGHFMQLELCAPRVHESVLRALAMSGG